MNRQVYGEEEAYFTEESLSVYEALKLYTTQASDIAQTTDRTGFIKEGYEADFTVLNKNPFKIDKRELATVQAVKTVVNGKIVYESE
ncbi:Amidohydrolase family [Staphylococcus aureus]|nr:Amidohydrolase family [Staphylococcus aureus]